MRKTLVIEPNDIKIIEWDRHTVYKDRKTVRFYINDDFVLELQLTPEQVEELKLNDE